MSDALPHYGIYNPPGYLFRPVRTRLLDELEAGLDKQPKVLSLIAPVGFGKTVLMGQLYDAHERAGRACAWLGLDHQTVNVSRMAQQLRAAINPEHREKHAHETLFSVEEPPETLINTLIGVISRLTRPTTIFIDNLNSCDDSALDQLLDALIFRTPPDIRFIWSSTTVPQFSLAHARLEGLVRQIGFKDLSLDRQETREMLGVELAEQLGHNGIETILQRTEGWPAGVRMARIILASSEHPRAILADFSGSDEDVAAMLNRHVMQGFSRELRTFICSLADINSFSVEMCLHITANAQAQRHIELLLKRNVFLIPLDRNRQRYRFHRLFQEYLRSEADRLLSPAQRRQILASAANWCERNQQWQDAINYALAAGEHAQASRLLDHTGTLFVRDRGDIQQFIHWIEQLQPGATPLGWEAQFWFVWALILHRQYTYALEQLEVLAGRLREHNGQQHDAPPEDLPHRIDHLRICIDLFNDRIHDAHQGCERWLTTVRKCAPYNVCSVYRIKSICLASSFSFTEARQTMRIADHIELASGSAYTTGWVDLIYGTISLYEGNFIGARKYLSSGLSKAREALGEDAVLCGLFALANTLCAVEMGKDQEARQLFLSGLNTTHVHGLVDTASYGFEAAIKLWDGEAENLQLIDHLRDIANSYPPRLSLMLSCHLIRRLLRLGREEEAFDEARSNMLEGGSGTAERHAGHLRIPRFRDLCAMTRIDLHIARGAFHEAEKRIAHSYGVAQKNGLAARMVELNLAKLDIALQTGNTPAAGKALSCAIITAAPRGIVRPFIDHAQSLATLVNDTRPSAWTFAHDQERAFFTEICAKLPINSALHNDLLGIQAEEHCPHASLTPREVELLTLLETGLSNQQIADYTHVSITTVKWHLKNLYRKLGVANRLAALARARTQGLLTHWSQPLR